MATDFIEVSDGFHIPYKYNKVFKQFCTQGILDLPLIKPDIQRILNVVTEIKIVDKLMVDTITGKSNEGQMLLGKKIIINGIISYRIEYETNDFNKSICIMEFNTNFSNYIIMKNEQYDPLKLKIMPYLQHIVIYKVNKRKIFYGGIILLNVVDGSYNFNNKCDSIYKLKNKRSLFLTGSKGDGIELNNEFFSSYNICDKFKIDCEKPRIKQIISTINEPEIIYSKIINTLKGVSCGGQFLSGKIVVVLIKVRQKIFYEADADNDEKSVYVIENELYKYCYVVIPELIEKMSPEDLLRSKLLQYSIKIEDASAIKINSSTIFTSLTMQLIVNFIPTCELCYSEYDDNGNSGLYMMYEDGSRKIKIMKKEGTKILKPSWSPSGESIAMLLGGSEKYKLYIMDFKNLSLKKLLTPLNVNYISDYCWTKDSRKILFTGVCHDSKDIYMVDFDVLKYRKLTFSERLTKSYSPKELSKNKIMVFLKSTSNIVNIWAKDICGCNTRQVTNCGYIKEFDCSGNGENIIYVFDKGGKSDLIYNICMANNQESLKVGCNDISIKKEIKFSPNDRFISFIGIKDNIYNIYVYDNEDNDLYNITNHYINSIVIQNYIWKIDSTKIYYTLNDLGYYNIYSIDLVTGKREQLTNGTTSNTYICYRPETS
ncbi:MAG: hypothetical protein KZY61_01850 [Clostridiaceae bacterium]|nr:hypothetical protein [Clostridiaceae bacterium]MBW4859552.1 hypothetical protein [Clostridiaceae bacterium]MBW4867397.1 hypothetical protein [Clostridiaceae bacterium]